MHLYMSDSGTLGLYYFSFLTKTFFNMMYPSIFLLVRLCHHKVKLVYFDNTMSLKHFLYYYVLSFILWKLKLHVDDAIFEDAIFCITFVIKDHTTNLAHHSASAIDCSCDIFAKNPSHKCDIRFGELKALIEGLDYRKWKKMHNIHAYCDQKWVDDVLNEENIFVKELT